MFQSRWDRASASRYYYTPNGYIVPAELAVHFLPRMKNIPKQTKSHLNEIGLTLNFVKDKFD